MIYADRKTAGRLLSKQLVYYADRKDTIVLALPRGGVPVASEIAKELHAPLDILVVRKLGAPWDPEFAAGAIGPGGEVVMNPEVQNSAELRDEALALVIRKERAELERREQLYRGDRQPPALKDRTVILVDDGVATGSTMHAAVLALRAMKVRTIVIAVPVCPPDVQRYVARVADRVICLQRPADFVAVGAWYEDFPQLSDDEVMDLLAVAET